MRPLKNLKVIGVHQRSRIMEDQRYKCFIEWKATSSSRAVEVFSVRHVLAAKYAWHVSKYPNRPSATWTRLLRAYSDRLIVLDWEGIKRAGSKSKVGTLRFETWLFDERIRRADELGVALDRFGKWFDRFVHFFCLLLSMLWLYDLLYFESQFDLLGVERQKYVTFNVFNGVLINDIANEY